MDDMAYGTQRFRARGKRRRSTIGAGRAMAPLTLARLLLRAIA